MNFEVAASLDMSTPAAKRASYELLVAQVRSVLDLDSPLAARFDAEDARGFAAAVALLADGTDWP